MSPVGSFSSFYCKHRGGFIAVTGHNEGACGRETEPGISVAVCVGLLVPTSPLYQKASWGGGGTGLVALWPAARAEWEADRQVHTPPPHSRSIHRTPGGQWFRLLGLLFRAASPGNCIGEKSGVLTAALIFRNISSQLISYHFRGIDFLSFPRN